MKKRNRSVIICLFCFFVLSVFAACGQGSPSAKSVQPTTKASDNKVNIVQTQPPNEEAEWQKVVEAAKKEGKVVVSGTPSEILRTQLTSFTKNYPDIKIEYSAENGSSFFPKLQKERDVNQYLWDLRVGSTGIEVYLGINQGVLQPIRPMLRPDIAKDSTWVGGLDSVFGDNKKQYVLHWDTTHATGIEVNNDFIPAGEIKSFTDLLDPKYKGKIVLFDPRSGLGSGNQAMAMYLLRYGEKAVTELLSKQELVISSDKRQIAEWVIRGRYPISIGMGQDSMVEYRKKGLGENVKSIFEPNVAGSEAVIMFDRAPHPNAAKVYINWLLSQETQTNFAKASEVNSRRADVKPSDPANVIDPNHVNNVVFIAYEKNMQSKKDAAELAKKYLK